MQLFPISQNTGKTTVFLGLQKHSYMGTVWSQPKSMIEHLVKACDQLCKHWCEQFTCVTGKSGLWVHPSLTSSKGWQPQGNGFSTRRLPSVEYLVSPDPWKRISCSFFITELLPCLSLVFCIWLKATISTGTCPYSSYA